MARAWYVAKVEPHREFSAKTILERNGVTVFLPSFFRKFANRHIRLSLLFNGYLFFSLDDPRRWPEVARTVGIIDVITHQPSRSEHRVATMIDGASIESLRQQSLSYDESDGKSAPKSYITAGCFVRIIGGPFSGEEPEDGALVEWSDQKRATLMLRLFNKTTRVEFYQKDLELIDGQSR